MVDMPQEGKTFSDGVGADAVGVNFPLFAIGDRWRSATRDPSCINFLTFVDLQGNIRRTSETPTPTHLLFHFFSAFFFFSYFWGWGILLFWEVIFFRIFGFQGLLALHHPRKIVSKAKRSTP